MHEREEARKMRKQERLQRQREAEERREQQRIESERIAAQQEANRKLARKQEEMEARALQAKIQQRCAMLEQTAAEKNCQRLLKHGLRQWGKTMIKQKTYVREAEVFFSRLVWRRVRSAYNQNLVRREEMAQAHRTMHLMKRCFHVWTMTKRYIEQNFIIARQFDNRRLLKCIFFWKKKALVFSKLSSEKFERDLIKAKDFAYIVVQRWYFHEWQEGIQRKKDERWREYRKSVLRNRVRACLEDSTFEKLCNATTIESCFPDSALGYESHLSCSNDA